MSDIILESLRALVVGLVLLTLFKARRAREVRNVDGWQTILLGFGLIFFGVLIDITDNFPSLNHFVVIGDTPVEAFLEKEVGYLMGFIFLSIGIRKWLPQVIEHQRSISASLEQAQGELDALKSLLPICASCKKIRDDNGYWNQLEEYMSEHADVKFSHGICPTCTDDIYPGVQEKIMARRQQKS